VLLEAFLRSLGQYRLAEDAGVAARRVDEGVHGKRAITANTALRLGGYFDTPAQFWMNLQSYYDLGVGRDKLGNRLETEVHSISVA